MLSHETEGVMTALTEEVGEVAKALLEEPWQNVVDEAVQVATMALRLAVEGDPTMTEVRRTRLNAAAKAMAEQDPPRAHPQGLRPRCPYLGCSDPCRATPPCALCYE